MREVIVLTHDRAGLEKGLARCGRPSVFADTLAELTAIALTHEWCDAVIDRAHESAEAALAHLASTERRVLLLADAAAGTLPGARVLVAPSVLARALTDLATARPPRPPSASLDRLLGATVLGGQMDDAIDAAAHEVAVAFGVARCIVSERAEPTGAVPTDGATWDLEAWGATARLCRQAALLEATTIVAAPDEAGACDSYLAVPLEGSGAGKGFVGVIATGARVFTADERATLHSIAARLGRELRWRAVHDRTADELERTLSGPGLDPLLGIWNRNALDQLAHSYVSSAKRYKMPLTMLAVRVVDLAGINTRHGVAIGDRLLRRIADALKPAVRAEDVVGRYSGTMLAVLLQGSNADDSKRIAERVQGMLAQRSIELPEGVTVPIATTIGITSLREAEDASQLLARTTRATKVAPDNVITIVSGPTTLSGRVPHATDSPALQMRATLGGTYRLRHEISRGGMGVVYRADDLALERPVAIKMLRPELAEDKEIVQHLRREAALLARVHHSNLVQIYNFSQSEGDCYFVMELVEGESLQQAIDRHRAEDTRMPAAEMLGVIDQIASALDTLHERGIYHRDVKPANFIRDPFSGRSVLVDVGIAHSYGDLSKQAGTPGYMAPEVIRGLPANARSDVYGLAASVYAMLTLAAPWGDGDAVQIITRQCSDPPPRVSTLRPELAAIDDVLAESLAIDDERRPKTAGALARALGAALGTILPAGAGRARGTRARPEATTAQPRTRGVVFRSVARALGVRNADKLRDAMGPEHTDLATAMAQCAPLSWAPTELFTELVTFAPHHVGRDALQLARDIARATVRTSFRSFFPASAATLHPERTLSAIRSIWARYHSWGNIAAIPIRPGENIVRMTETLQERALCAWTAEMLETLVVLSGGAAATVAQESCEADGDDACTFRVKWNEP